MLSKAAKSLAVVTAAFFWAGCAITDYVGWAKHDTQAEAKLWGAEVGIRVSPDPDGVSGTFNYTVDYDCRANANAGLVCVGGSYSITTWRNAGFSVVNDAAFSWDGIVDRDGDDLNGRYGSPRPPPFTPTHKWQKRYVAQDNQAGCQFFTNPRKDFGPPPPIAACFLAPNEEIDHNLDLQDAFTSLDDLMSRIWAGALAGSFTLELTSVQLNATPVTLSEPLAIGVRQNGFRPVSFAIDLSTPGGKELIQAILTNTTSGEPVSMTLGFAGGMSVSMPVNWVFAFDHEQLEKAL